MKLEQIIELKRNNFEIKVPVAKGNSPAADQATKEDKKLGNPNSDYIEPNPCEDGYEAIGLKEKDGKMVPNCVPIKAEKMETKVNLADYPWDQCIADQTERYGDEETAKRVCGAIKAMYGSKEYEKEGFVIPSPESGEDQNAFVSRCIKEISDEYDQQQAIAICYSKWQQ